MTVSSQGVRAKPPKFTLCPAAHDQTCSIGDLSAEQAIEVFVTGKIGTKATVGEQITLSVAVQGVGLSPASASITAVVGVLSPSPTSSPPLTVPPPFPPVLPGPTVVPSGLNSLFPTVTPTAAPSVSSLKRGRVAAATQTASTLPLDPRLIGGQLAGLAGLAAAVTLVVARLSLRPASPAVPTTPPAPTPEVEVEAPADSPADEN